MPDHAERPLIASRRGMVSAAHPLAAAAGAQVLREGGNAFDAIVATAAVLNVAEPFMSGLAGCGMAVLWSAAERRARALDFVPPVPSAFCADGTRKRDIFIGAGASLPPGNLAGWARLATDHGRWPLERLLAPAIRLARDGVPVTRTLPEVTGQWLDLRRHDAEWLRVYTDGAGRIPPGWVLRQPDLAATLEAIAADGIGHLYGGALGERMVAHLRGLGGWLSMADLEAVAPRWSQPLSAAYRDLTLCTSPPPAEAFQFALTLAVLERFDLARMPRDGLEHLDTLCRAVRVAAEARITSSRADPARVAALFDADAVAAMAGRVRDGAPLDGRTQQWRAMLDPALVGQREHTTSFSAADADGNLVCITQSLGSVYGSGVVIPGTGVCMNNFLNWGDLDPQAPNALVAGDAMAMCLAPCIALRAGEPVLAIGTPGSYGILQTQAQALVQYLDHGLGLQAAIEAPRLRLWDGRLVHVESRIDEAVIDGLRARGHDARAVEPFTRKVGGFHAVARDPASGVLTGAADPRRDGYAVPA